MNILDMTIVKQTNGKFALWNEKDQTFAYQNYESAEALKNRILEKAAVILTDNILSYALDDTHFKMYVESYKIQNGLSDSRQVEAAATLKEMGVSVEDF
ncbi:MAG: hypothetical protein MI863_20675 [Desulfobacterales bacterium]|nr:hypothetical protein [Desulfobacterales bacterium]